MEELKYIGEHTLPGQLGHLFTILSLVGALFATISYFFYTQSYKDNFKEGEKSWLNMARVGFGIHGFSVVAIVVILFMMIQNHYYEYNYVFSHSSNDLPVRYMISCFWEGQEGSFLLWTFWHVILGGFMVVTGRKWEGPVMTVLCFTQIFLAAMLIGIYFFGYKIGSSPFILLRDFYPANPAFMNPEYMTTGILNDGNGLNPLLQNYWMVIHPPVLFLGFSSILFPFAYILSGLWKGDFGKDWVLPTLRWSLFSVGFLGIGILMGGAWAYESLSFGGYWAWDPVENSSFVPWVIGICGIHTLLAYKHSGHALRATVVFLSLSFLLILYSTFLTRSGILGDTSVHAFVDLGMSGQLLVFLFAFVGLTVGLTLPGKQSKLLYFASFIILLVVNIVVNIPELKWLNIGFFAVSILLLFYGMTQTVPAPEKEEPLYSREFWLFVGSLVMAIVAGIITWDTSLPAINKLFGTSWAVVDAVNHYNSYTIWFGILVLLLAVTTLFLRYKSSTWQPLKRVIYALLVSLVATAFIAYAGKFPMTEELNLLGKFKVPFLSPLIFLLFASIYAIIGNLAYILQVLKGKINVAGSAVAHLGFGLMLLGVLISSGKKEVISLNKIGLDYGEEFSMKDKMENIFLAKNRPVQMGNYWVTYEDIRTERDDTYYKIRYEKKENQADKAAESFVLEPYAQVNPKMGLVTNPSSKKYLTKDVFTYISSIPDNTDVDDAETSFKEMELGVGDTMAASNALVILEGINPNPIHSQYFPQPNDIAMSAQLTIKTLDQTLDAEPIYYIRGREEFRVPHAFDEFGISVDIAKVLPESGKIRLAVTEIKKPLDYVIMKAIVFPFINILWLGCIVMSLGFFMSLWQRWKEGKLLNKRRNKEVVS